MNELIANACSLSKALCHPFSEGKPIRVLIIRSGAKDKYENIIIDAFRERLLSEDRNIRVLPAEETPDFRSVSQEGTLNPEWRKTLEKIEIDHSPPNDHIDYIITTGTHTSKAVIAFDLVNKLGATGQIFLGVTDPFFAGLTAPYSANHKDLKDGIWRYDKREFAKEYAFHQKKIYITGVQYGTGGKEFGELTDKLFEKDQKLVFLYNENALQDTAYAQALRKLNAFSGENRFEVRALPYTEKRTKDRPITWEDVTPYNQSQEVYLAWHDLDDLNSRENSDDKNKAILLSSCSSGNLSVSGMVISVKDAEIGEAGAKLLLENINISDPRERAEALAETPVAAAPFHTWVNMEAVKRFSNSGVPPIKIKEEFQRRYDRECS